VARVDLEVRVSEAFGCFGRMRSLAELRFERAYEQLADALALYRSWACASSLIHGYAIAALAER
jgi:hypothetical protein